MKVVSVLITCLLLISAVSCEDLTCKAGEGVAYGKIFTSGLASQCSGVSKITTEAECKLAAEYNRKNNIDKNVRYGGRVSGWIKGAIANTILPPGCFYYISNWDNEYRWNDNTKSTKQCSNDRPCICKTKTCIKCPINTFNSKGGTNPTCTPCPKDRPTTNFTTGQTKCIPVPTIKCEPGYGNYYDGILTPKKCVKCPINHYSEGGINPKCTECPSHAPFTATNIDTYHSINVCTKKKYIHTYCDGGKRSNVKVESTPIRTSGKCEYPIDTKEECIAQYKRTGVKSRDDSFLIFLYNHWMNTQALTDLPPGCVTISAAGHRMMFNNNLNSSKTCTSHSKCLCKRKICFPCPPNTYKPAGTDPFCHPCVKPFVTDDARTKCFNPEIEIELAKFKKQLIAQKEETNDLSIKNSRLWQKEQVRLQHDKIMQARKQQDDKNEKKSCIEQRSKGTVVFPAIEISTEIEKIEDTTCIDTNRDELLKSFCSFTSDLDNLFQIQSIDKEAKSFWPNICCKERRDTTLEVCKDPSGTLNRGEIVPFALSSGGNFSRHNLYVEVTDTIKKNGYLHTGMKDLLKSLGTTKTKHARELVDSFFNEVSLCGPRIVDEPGAKDKTKLCELFIPYKHAMTNFYNLIKSLYQIRLSVQEASFLETVEKSFEQRQLLTSNRLGKGNMNNIGIMMKSKPSQEKNETCTGGSEFGHTELIKMKRTFCKGYNPRFDTRIKNIAVYYLRDSISFNDTQMFSLEDKIRYDVQDTSCPSKLFEAEDISIQQVNMDTLGKEKEWVAVVNLNTQDKNGYLQSELPYCKVRKYLIGAKTVVKAYIDDDGCCNGLKDYKQCQSTCDEEGLIELKDNRKKHYSKDVVLTGTHYDIKNSLSRRRMLLQNSGGGECPRI